MEPEQTLDEALANLITLGFVESALTEDGQPGFIVTELGQAYFERLNTGKLN